MSLPKVSIITVVYNGAQYIEQTIKSVINQDYQHLEYIIIDGGSIDGTQDIIRKHEKDIAFWVSEKDTGIYNAMNKGWRKSTGDIIAMLNADDYYLEGAIAKVADSFIEHNPDIVYGNLTKCREINGENFLKEVYPNLEIMRERMGIFHPSTFVAKKVYNDLDGYNEEYKLSSDYDFLLRAYNKKYNFQYLNKSLTVFRIGGQSKTDCNSYKEVYQILVKNNSMYAPQMKKEIYRCYFKRGYKKIIITLVKVFGLQSLLNKRLIKKWR